jgi:hypothetical protein
MATASFPENMGLEFSGSAEYWFLVFRMNRWLQIAAITGNIDDGSDAATTLKGYYIAIRTIVNFDSST